MFIPFSAVKENSKKIITKALRLYKQGMYEECDITTNCPYRYLKDNFVEDNPEITKCRYNKDEENRCHSCTLKFYSEIHFKGGNTQW